MTKLLSIGLYIYDALSNDPAVNAITEGRIYPLVTDKTPYPFIVFTRDQVDPDYDKNGPASGAFVTAEIMVVAETYPMSIEIAEAVLAALDGVTSDREDFRVDFCELTGANEAYTNDAFVQILNFRFHIN